MFVRRRSSLLPVAALAGVAACLVLAADGPADPLLKLRGEWRTRVAADTKALREQYAASLAKLESDLATAGDYASAARARRERNRLAPSSGGSGGGESGDRPDELPEGAPVELNTKSGALSGGVTHDKEAGTLTNWSAAGAAARWLLPKHLKAGGYEVELTFSCASSAGGELLVKEDRHTLRRTIHPTAGWDDWQTKVIGTLRLTANSRTLELTAAAVQAPALFQLKTVRLLPLPARK